MPSTSKNKIPVIVIGLGPVGLATLQAVGRVSALQLVAGVDSNPALAGKRLHEIAGGQKALLPDIIAGIDKLPSDLPPGSVAILCTSSRFRDIEPLMRALAERKISVVSSCEPLAHPTSADPEFAMRMDALCKKLGVAMVGTGVNPGLAMDALPSLLLRGSLNVKRVEVVRHLDLSQRRTVLQHKIGIGMSRVEFGKAESEGAIGHAGLEQSAQLIAQAAGWTLDPFEVALTPAFDGDRCVGLRHEIDAKMNDEPVIRLELFMKMNLQMSFDAISIEGTPPIHCRIEGGLKGEEVTIATLVNTAQRIHRMPPGIHNTLDIPLW
jgi:2,4-diaminopentanoate dehydrogenase